MNAPVVWAQDLDYVSTMVQVQDIVTILDEFAPPRLAEEWDNVGLLVGDREASVQRVMTCLTVTDASANEAVDRKAQLIVSHHPLPFHPLRQITTDTQPGRLLLKLIAAGVAVYSPHTAFDSARAGINQHLATAIGLSEIAPLVRANSLGDEDLGSGRWGIVPGNATFREVVDRLQAALPLGAVRVVGAVDQPITRVGIACGSGGSLFAAAEAAGCDCFLTGETDFHTCLAAEASGIALVLTGHFASERFALDVLAEFLSEQLPGINVWASQNERDPIRVV